MPRKLTKNKFKNKCKKNRNKLTKKKIKILIISYA